MPRMPRPMAPSTPWIARWALCFRVALVNRTEPARDVVAVLEVFDVGRAALDRTLVGEAAQFLGVQARRGSERGRG
jgi:hypothetical protein